jgi:hypothetical protein
MKKFSINNNSSILLVGSSGELKERKLGKVIDTYDVVCRINGNGDHKVLNKENKDIIGTKSNIWFCLESTGIKRNNPSLIKQFDLVFVTSKKIYNENKFKYKNLRLFPEEIANNCKNTLYGFNECSLKYDPTSGIKAIFYFITHFQETPLEKGCMGTVYNNFHLCGFDGFKSGHWYGNKFIKNQDESDANARIGLGRHYVEKEYEYIKHLEKNKLLKII